MPYCPDCGYEYNSDVRECPDCGSELMDRLPENKEEPFTGKFVKLGNFPGKVYAEMLKGALEERGIPAYIRSDGVMDAYGISGTGPVTRGVTLWVPEADLEECERIRNEMMDHI